MFINHLLALTLNALFLSATRQCNSTLLTRKINITMITELELTTGEKTTQMLIHFQKNSRQ